MPFRQAKAGVKRIEREHKGEFWAGSKARRYKTRHGCTSSQSRSEQVIELATWVASNRLQEEVFTNDKLNRYNQFLADRKRGRPVLFLVVAPLNRGKPAKSKIGAMEKELIKLAKAANPGMGNKIGIKAPRWGIAGVIRGGKGKTGGPARALRQILGIE